MHEESDQTAWMHRLIWISTGRLSRDVKISFLKYDKCIGMFCCKIWVAHIFAAQISMYLKVLKLQQFTSLSLNKLIKLTMLWTTGPWLFFCMLYRPILKKKGSFSYSVVSCSGRKTPLCTSPWCISFAIIWAHSGYFENRVPLKPVLGKAYSLTNYHYKNMPIQIYWKFYHRNNSICFFIFMLKT